METDNKAMVIASQQQQMFLPTLLQAVRESDIEKQQDKLLTAFRKIDMSKNELAVSLNSLKRNINILIKQMGRPEVTAIVRVLLVNFNQYFNVNRGLNTLQIKEIAEQIIDECGNNLTIDELIYMLKKAKTDVNSIHYERLDGSVIFEIIDNHYLNRGNQRDNRHKDYKSDHTFIIPSKEVSEKLEKIKETLQYSVAKDKIAEEEKKQKEREAELAKRNELQKRKDITQQQAIEIIEKLKGKNLKNKK